MNEFILAMAIVLSLATGVMVGLDAGPLDHPCTQEEVK